MTKPTFYDAGGAGPFAVLERRLGGKPAAAGKERGASQQKKAGKRGTQGRSARKG
jgi:hypothetical protein